MSTLVRPARFVRTFAVLALLALGCAEPPCPPARAIVVYAQTASGAPIDDLALVCSGGSVESVPLGAGEHTCGTEAGVYDVAVVWGSRAYRASGLEVGRSWARCGGPSTLEIAVVFPDP